ncbi:MAG: SDR family oxidoreductase [Gammaproteobacteria bacterium]|nr:SDR family oxidoreductase [Gammaproteobacteria bacterium]
MSRTVLACLLTALLLIAGALPGLATATDEARPMTGTVLITGSNRGIGFAFARYYTEQGWQVIATCRTPARAADLQALSTEHDNLAIEQLDITNPEQVAALVARLNGRPIDLLINNAAYLGDPAPQEFGQLDYDFFNRSVQVNLIGPLRVTEALLDNVAASKLRKIIFLGSAAGSHGLLGPGQRLYAYRASKAGLHFAVHELSMDLAPKGITVGLLNPGIVDTMGVLDLKPGDPVPDVFKPLMPLIQSGQLKLIRPSESVAGMAQLIDGLTPERAGRFFNVDGQELPW